jgi:micrococcal nuclease
MKAARFSLALLAAVTALPLPGRAAERFDCGSAARENVRLASVGERLDVVLADGRMVTFPTLEPPRPTPGVPDRPRVVAAELTSLLTGRNLTLQRLAGPDRWGRIPARLFVECEAESADETLAATGLAMASVEAGACGANVRAAEAAARADRLGIWADPDFALLSGGDERRDFSARAGTVALVEGRISSIGHTAPRLYLNFGSGRGCLSLTIARRNQPLFERAGLTEKSLLHKTLRARGVLEIGAGPQIELFHPNQIEFMEDRR